MPIHMQRWNLVREKLPKLKKVGSTGTAGGGSPIHRISKAISDSFASPWQAVSKDRGFGWFWINTADNSDLSSWLQDDELLADVMIVEKSIDKWFRKNFARPPPVNFFHFSEVHSSVTLRRLYIAI